MQRENCTSPPYFEKHMTLQEILYGTFKPPCNTPSRLHRIGFEECNRYVPVVDMRKPMVDGMNKAQLTMYNRLKHQIKRVTAVEMAKKMRVTTNHARVVLGELFKLGKVERSKITVDRKFCYVYKIKE